MNSYPTLSKEAFSAGLRSLIHGFGHGSKGLETDHHECSAREPETDSSFAACSRDVDPTGSSWQQRSDGGPPPMFLKPPFHFKLGNEHIQRKMEEEEAKQRQLEDAFLLSLASEHGNPARLDSLLNTMQPPTMGQFDTLTHSVQLPPITPGSPLNMPEQGNHTETCLSLPPAVPADAPPLPRRNEGNSAAGQHKRVAGDDGQQLVMDSSSMENQESLPASATVAPGSATDSSGGSALSVTNGSQANGSGLMASDSSQVTTVTSDSRRATFIAHSSRKAASAASDSGQITSVTLDGGQATEEEATRLMESLTSSGEREGAAREPRDELRRKLEEVSARNRGGGGGENSSQGQPRRGATTTIPDIENLPFSRHMNEQLMESLMLVVGSVRAGKH
eukprot:jgi/Mesvir1/27558/Mv07308-RA.1